MAIVKCKPTSPGRRHVVKIVNADLYKGKPYAPLLEKNSKSGGRNNNGRITVRHIGGGHKQHYRVIDFKRTKDGIPARRMSPQKSSRTHKTSPIAGCTTAVTMARGAICQTIKLIARQ
jgi:ribosomal protein L2